MDHSSFGVMLEDAVTVCGKERISLKLPLCKALAHAQLH
jgi:hypothetical protein